MISSSNSRLIHQMCSNNCSVNSDDHPSAPEEITIQIHTAKPTSNRPLESGDHPVVAGQYTLITPAVSKAVSEVARWLNYRLTGGTFFGIPGVGKSQFIAAAIKILQNKFTDLAIVTILAKSHGKANDKAFFSNFLGSMNHCYALTGPAEAMRSRLEQELERLAGTSSTRTVLMFVDEAQKLHEMDFHLLVDIKNQMDKDRTHLIVALVGQ